MLPPYDALLIVGFGGPEKPEDVMPFLENVVRGRNVPRERLLEVAEHYHHFNGVSPINQQVRDLIDALKEQLPHVGIDLPVYWGNRNWHPLLDDTMRQMAADGVKHALGVVLAAYSSYSSCRQYREDIDRARQAVGPDAPVVDKMRVYYNHPGFVAANALHVKQAVEAFPPEQRDAVRLVFTAHSIPSSMASQCNYERQLREASRLVAESIGLPADRWDLVYQSRSGPPQVPWLEPDILDHIRALAQAGTRHLVIHPIGFLSDHMEVLYDLDEEARHLCDELGIRMERSKTVGTNPVFVRMLAKLIRERVTGSEERAAMGAFGPSHDVCPLDCCLPPARPGADRPPGR
jgi:ferrochelatase